ncbi:PREDICTED: myomegalin-like [Condylura cristata]|uniref:myomegalin-like n=1 Tax=Condylura cristata TaxID=143302 RepID=UPI00064343D4|nr:PREDICTED: myomegalin-like [Condylura cristata]
MEVTQLQKSLRGLSGNCCSLIQDQARELTRLQQKMRIGKAVSSHLIQHVKNTMKNFEELLSSSKIDHYMEQHFREQLAKGSQLAENLASKFSTGDCKSKKDAATETQQTLCILRDLQKRKAMGYLQRPQGAGPQIPAGGQAQPARQPPPPTQQQAPAVGDAANVGPATPADPASLPSNPSGASAAQPFSDRSDAPEAGRCRSCSPWEEMRPQKMNAAGDLSSFSSLYRPSSKPSGADLLEKNLTEIQSLRQRLEESVCINDRLRERLELVLSARDHGKALCVPQHLPPALRPPARSSPAPGGVQALSGSLWLVWNPRPSSCGCRMPRETHPWVCGNPTRRRRNSLDAGKRPRRVEKQAAATCQSHPLLRPPGGGRGRGAAGGERVLGILVP